MKQVDGSPHAEGKVGWYSGVLTPYSFTKNFIKNPNHFNYYPYIYLMSKRYPPGFERDFSWYLSVRQLFNFDGTHTYYNKKGQHIIIYSKSGVSGKEAFFQYDSNGVIKPTKHPRLLHNLLKTKGSINLHVKMYAEDRANGILPRPEFEQMCDEFKAPDWFYNAVEAQRVKIVKSKSTT